MIPRLTIAVPSFTSTSAVTQIN